MCARMHRADWQYQCAHLPSPIALPPHCPPPIPRAIRVGCYRDAITRRQYAQAQPSDDPPFTWLAGSGDRRPYWLLEMFRFGGFQAPTDALESPRVLPYILKVSKDILIIRISGNQFVSQTRHRRTQKISRPIFGPGPHKIIRRAVSILGHAHVRGTRIRVWVRFWFLYWRPAQLQACY